MGRTPPHPLSTTHLHTSTLPLCYVLRVCCLSGPEGLQHAVPHGLVAAAEPFDKYRYVDELPNNASAVRLCEFGDVDLFAINTIGAVWPGMVGLRNGRLGTHTSPYRPSPALAGRCVEIFQVWDSFVLALFWDKHTGVIY